MNSERLQLITHFAPLANDYAQAAVIPQEIARRMIERLSIIQITPEVIIDLGCGPGQSLSLLRAHYPQAQIIGMDITFPMLQQIPEMYKRLCGDVQQMPLKKASVDLIFANFLLPWGGNIEAVFKNIREILKPGGLLLFSTFGPETCHEVSAIPQLIDMHIIGDLLGKNQFIDPVVDVQHIALRYADTKKIATDLYRQGWHYFLDAQQIATVDANEISFEVICGQAWAPLSQLMPGDDVVSFPANKILRRVHPARN